MTAPDDKDPLYQQDFLIVRHGPSRANKLGVFAGGKVDSLLTSGGEKSGYESRKLIEKMPDGMKPHCIVHTGLSRTAVYADIINKALKLPIMQNTRLAERNWGELEGKNKADYPDHHPHRQNPPGGESKHDFYARSLNAMRETLDQFPGKRILFVAHRGTIEGLIESHGYKLPGEPANSKVYHFKPKASVAPGEFPWEVTTMRLNERDNVEIEPVRLVKKTQGQAAGKG